jgi:hypothetical protein
MAVDVLRSCYRSRMRIDPARPELTVEFEWFFCPPGAKLCPYPTAFSSRNWTETREDADLTLGEVEVTKRYVDGTCPPGVTGQFFCGDPSHAANGCDLVSGPVVDLDPYDGVLLCCRGGVPWGDDDVRDINFWKQAGTSPISVLYTGGSVTGENATVNLAEADVIHALPFFPSRGGTLDKLGFWLAAPGDPGARIRCAIYECASETNILPDNLIIDTVELVADSGSVTWRLDDIDITLDPKKLYWLCVLANNQATMPTIGAMPSTFYFNVLGFSSSAFESKFGLKVPFPYALFPNTFPPVDNTMLAAGVIAVAAVRYSG